MFKKSSYALAAIITVLSSAQATEVLSLEHAIKRANKTDPWLLKSNFLEKSKQNLSEGAVQRPNPKLSIGLMNLPTDGWQFNQEAMTQFNIGVSQQFSRGDTLAILKDKYSLQASQFPLFSLDRQAKVKRLVSELWLKGFQAQETIRLINADKVLFEQLMDITTSNYATTRGGTSQQNIISAQLELIKLQDRLLVEQQNLEEISAQVLSLLADSNSPNLYQFSPSKGFNSIYYGNALPIIPLISPEVVIGKRLNYSELAARLSSHPLVVLENKKQAVAKQDIGLAKQKYKPQWGISANYGYRDDTPDNQSRSDFFSIGVTFDMPIFNEAKQGKVVMSSVENLHAIETDKTLLLRNMIGEVEKNVKSLHRLEERFQLYETLIIDKTSQQAESALTAYTNDNGEFSEVVRARIDQLNMQVAKLAISVEALVITTRLNYLLTTSELNLNGIYSFGEHQ